MVEKRPYFVVNETVETSNELSNPVKTINELNVVVTTSPILRIPVDKPICKKSTRRDEIYAWPTLIELILAFCAVRRFVLNKLVLILEGKDVRPAGRPVSKEPSPMN